LLERGGGLDLALEAAHRQSLGELGREYFDRDFPLEPHILGLEDATHSAAAQLALEAICVAECVLKLRPKVGGQVDLWE
jgi:hypothetical protein